jgi:hypothetical protein
MNSTLEQGSLIHKGEQEVQSFTGLAFYDNENTIITTQAHDKYELSYRVFISGLIE